MRSVGILYGLTGDPRYAAWVAEGLLKSVEMFTHDEFREGDTGGLYFSPLYDSQILMLLARSYELTRDSDVYDNRDHKSIISGIFPYTANKTVCK